jgi:uncharacterized protein (TIGR03437 family)
MFAAMTVPAPGSRIYVDEPGISIQLFPGILKGATMNSWKFYLAAPCLAAAAFAQTIPVVLDIEIENAVRYFADTTDPAKLALSLSPVPPAATRAFTDTILIGDIVAVNGKPAKGLWTSRQFAMNFSPNPSPGSAVSDVTQGAIAECKYEILNAEGRFIGRLMDGGLFPHAVTGGTGAFLGAKGEQATTAARVVKALRTASMAEDPANRRTHGGGNMRIVMRLIPAIRPEIITIQGVPTVTHVDGRPVSSAAPAAAGEILSLYARGLGPATPNVDFGQPFPQSPLASVNAPVEVLVNGQSAEVLWAGGYPGAVDGYQVNFRVPQQAGPGPATLQLIAAWIPGSEVSINIRGDVR